MNLVKELGVQYMQDRFGYCMFYNNDGLPCYVDPTIAWGRGKVGVKMLEGPIEEVRSTSVQVPETFFTDLKVFSVPPLGWRMSSDGRYMAHFRRNNKSYQRAVAPKVMLRTLSPATQFLVDTDNVDDQYYNTVDGTVMLVMSPKYIRFREGLRQMREGELFSFAVTPNLAILPWTEGRQSIYFNTMQVGMVEENGDVNCPNPQVNALIEDSIK